MSEHRREEFEDHIKQEYATKHADSMLKPSYNVLLARNYDGTYFMGRTQEQWAAWCAAIDLIKQRLGESK